MAEYGCTIRELTQKWLFESMELSDLIVFGPFPVSVRFAALCYDIQVRDGNISQRQIDCLQPRRLLERFDAHVSNTWLSASIVLTK